MKLELKLKKWYQKFNLKKYQILIFLYKKCEEKRKKLRKELAQKRAAQKGSTKSNGVDDLGDKLKIDEDDPDKVIIILILA